MCGIAGIVKKKNGVVSKKELLPMVRAVAHRGPDDEGMYIKGNVGLGHRRLSILDVSLSGHQPMASDDGTVWITFNGEIYNYLELKNELGGRPYRSGSDTEVILRAYEQWGERCVEKFNGMFAFVIWDERRKKLFAARDHLGVKPFYYAFHRGNFYFGSEIKAVLAGGVPAQPNNKIIYEYLAYGYYQHSPETFFEGIRELPAGHTLTLRSGKLGLARYWDPASSVQDMSRWSDARVREEFMHLFENAVKIQLRSDVPVGIEVSGGIDSSALTATVHRISGGQKNYQSFSFSYGSHEIELPFMQELIRNLGWKGKFIHVMPTDMPKLMRSLTWHHDEPFPGMPTFGLYKLAEACRANGVPVVLGGQGGDEVGGGYEYQFGAFWLDLFLKGEGAAANRELSAYGKLHHFLEGAQYAQFLGNVLHAYLYPGTSADGSTFTHPEALRASFVKSHHEPRHVFPAPFDSHFQNMQYRDIVATKLPRVLHASDRATMAHGVEQRVPFVDYRLIAFGLSLPSRQKIRNGEQRFFMRRSFKKFLPETVRRAPKRAVPSPQRQWFKKELRPWIRSVLASKSFGARPYFNQDMVLGIYDRYCSTPGVPRNSFHVWQWLHLEMWLRTFFD